MRVRHAVFARCPQLLCGPGQTRGPLPRAHWTQIYSTNPLERLNADINRRTHVVSIFPNDASIVRLVGTKMPEQNDEWSFNRRYLQVEGRLTVSDNAPTRLSAVAR